MKHLFTILLLFVFLNGNAQSQGFNNAFGDEGYVTEGTNLGGEGFGEEDRPVFPFYEPESVLIFNAIDSLGDAPSETRKGLINNLILSLKGAGLFSGFDAFWMLAAESQTAAQINWKHPGKYTLTLVNSPSFTIDQGITGNGTTSYANTNFNASIHGVNATLNSISIGAYSRTNNNQAGSDMGVFITSRLQVTSRYDDNNFYAIANTTSLSSVNNSSGSLGLHIVSRTASNLNRGFKNGVRVINSSSTSTSIPNGNIFICGINSSGLSQPSTKQIAFAFVARGLTDDEVSTLTGLIEAYLDAIGAGVAMDDRMDSKFYGNVLELYPKYKMAM